MQNLKVTIGVAASAAVVVVGAVWTLRGDLVTQSQLHAAMTALDARLLPVAGQVVTLSDKLAAVAERLAKLEGRLDSSGRPPS